MQSADLYLFELPASCRVDDCSLVATTKAHQLCGPHYKRFWKYGDPTAGGPMRRRMAAAKAARDLPDGTRVCNTCDSTFPLDAFPKDGGGTGGRRSDCADCHSAKARAWYAANRERQAARQLARRHANVEQHRQWDMERYERDREKRIALATEQAHKRRLRIMAGEYDPTVTRANLRKQYGDQCHYCERDMDFGRYTHTTRPDNLATIEHVVPVSKGGGHTWDNVTLACLGCNLRKNAKPLDVWLSETEAA